MAGNTPPKHVKHIMITLQARGYRAFLVGGCVRDMILGAQPQDWDICTSALPEQVMEVFPGSRPTGLRHGTVTVTENAKSVEVTTFRSEGRYADHRHPDSGSLFLISSTPPKGSATSPSIETAMAFMVKSRRLRSVVRSPTKLTESGCRWSA